DQTNEEDGADGARRRTRATVRLISADLAGNAAVEFSAPRSKPSRTPFLSVDNDGSVLLAVAGEVEFSLLRIGASPCRHLKRLHRGVGRLVRRPIIDQGGYSFILQRVDGTL